VSIVTVPETTGVYAYQTLLTFGTLQQLKSSSGPGVAMLESSVSLKGMDVIKVGAPHESFAA
jgi:hypothetical protein